MKNQISKIIVALAIGLITTAVIGLFAGTSRHYLLVDGQKREVPEEAAADAKKNDRYYIFPTEREFNGAWGVPAGMVACAVVLLVYFGPAARVKTE